MTNDKLSNKYVECSTSKISYNCISSILLHVFLKLSKNPLVNIFKFFA